jgi:hypothetical protein
MTVSTNTDLANLALSHVGKTFIDSIDDNEEPAEVCKKWVDIARQLFLKQSKLHLAQKEVALAIAADETSNVYDYVYTAPADSIALVEIWNGNTASDPVLYKTGTHSSLNSTVIKTNWEDAILFYVVDIPNLTRYNVVDHIAMSYLLASLIAMPLKIDAQLTATIEAKYLVALSVAIANDKNSQSIDIVNNARFNSIENSRR